jgi:hypothetical protein
MLLATPNVAISLHAQAGNGLTTLFAEAKVYSSSGVLVATVNLPHIVGGLYGNTYTPTAEGMYTIVYQLFDDVLKTIPAQFDKDIETLDVNSERTNITRILGLAHENSVIDLTTYNIDGNLVSSRVRC